ncbi:hypothetical protein QR98_0007230 [Sarcoptes scabiei]|uniref:Uncharacterized protein n=1 Tax=Sarcoptes scabiei TaxID=52283 RepID=A0A131ZU88_SARSC|nr:hypothetical protein QR98_0007230 [Sarcoptes scabiei]
MNHSQSILNNLSSDADQKTTSVAPRQRPKASININSVLPTSPVAFQRSRTPNSNNGSNLYVKENSDSGNLGLLTNSQSFTSSNQLFSKISSDALSSHKSSDWISVGRKSPSFASNPVLNKVSNDLETKSQQSKATISGKNPFVTSLNIDGESYTSVNILSRNQSLTLLENSADADCELMPKNHPTSIIHHRRNMSDGSALSIRCSEQNFNIVPEDSKFSLNPFETSQDTSYEDQLFGKEFDRIRSIAIKGYLAASPTTNYMPLYSSDTAEDEDFDCVEENENVNYHQEFDRLISLGKCINDYEDENDDEDVLLINSPNSSVLNEQFESSNEIFSCIADDKKNIVEKRMSKDQADSCSSIGSASDLQNSGTDTDDEEDSQIENNSSADYSVDDDSDADSEIGPTDDQLDLNVTDSTLTYGLVANRSDNSSIGDKKLLSIARVRVNNKNRNNNDDETSLSTSSLRSDSQKNIDSLDHLIGHVEGHRPLLEDEEEDDIINLTSSQCSNPIIDTSEPNLFISLDQKESRLNAPKTENLTLKDDQSSIDRKNLHSDHETNLYSLHNTDNCLDDEITSTSLNDDNDENRCLDLEVERSLIPQVLYDQLNNKDLFGSIPFTDKELIDKSKIKDEKKSKSKSAEKAKTKEILKEEKRKEKEKEKERKKDKKDKESKEKKEKKESKKSSSEITGCIEKKKNNPLINRTTVASSSSSSLSNATNMILTKATTVSADTVASSRIIDCTTTTTTSSLSLASKTLKNNIGKNDDDAKYDDGGKVLPLKDEKLKRTQKQTAICDGNSKQQQYGVNNDDKKKTKQNEIVSIVIPKSSSSSLSTNKQHTNQAFSNMSFEDEILHLHSRQHSDSASTSTSSSLNANKNSTITKC